MDKEVNIKDIDMGSVVTLKHKGSFREFNLIYGQINKWIENNDFKIIGNHYSRFDPSYKDLSANNLVFQLGIPVSDRIQDENLVRIVEVPERDVISALYKGPYFNLPSVHGLLEDYARKHDLAPFDSPTEIYLNDPFEVNSNELLTEVQFTVSDFKVEDKNKVPLEKNIEKKIIKKHKMAIMEHYGFIEDVYKVRLDLVKWAEKRNINVEAIYFKHYYNPDGASPRGMVFEIGLPVDDTVKEEENMKIVEIPEHEVLSTIYKGPYTNIPNVTRMMVDYAFENELEIIDFAEEIYLNSIFDVSCDDLLTEVRMQVIDFKFDKNIQFEKKIERKTIPKCQIASIRQKGSFEKITKLKADLFDWIEKNNIKTSGDHFLRFLNHPRSLFPENIYYEVGIPLDRNVKDVIKVINFPRHKIMSMTHEGSISTLNNSHDFIINYAKENEFIPIDIPVNLFVESVPKNIDEEVLIEVGLPVKKI